MNTLIEMVSHDEYDKIKNRKLLEDSSKLIKDGFIDYDEILMPFGGITRSFYITPTTMQTLSNTKSNSKEKIKLDTLIRDEGMFELVESKTNLDDVVLHPSTRELLDNLLAQMDRKVINRLKEWGVKEKKSGIDARIIFYGPPGTGKTLTAYSLGKSLKKPILSFDCSKILSMYVGESEKNVRKIFDDFKEFSAKTKTKPILLLNEADQFLSSRTTGSVSGSDKMHNQMQNIFLEQIEKFDGVLIATTNLLENIDQAFSRRFNYKIEFKKPDESQRVKIWQLMLPESADYEEAFSIDELASYPLTGGQIDLIMKNTAYKVAIKEEPIFMMKDFIDEINREKRGNFSDSKSMGFLNKE
jgi:SpoVK/Ycf46/Vps4 family AAA+-type ATPase